MNTASTMETRLAEANTTIEELRNLYTGLLKRTNDAETALRFYAIPKNWSVSNQHAQGSKVLQDRLLEDYTDADNTTTTRVAGSRARVYFSLYGEK